MADQFAHRVVTRNADDVIIRDEAYPDLAAAEPVWSKRCQQVRGGVSVAIQRGGSVIKWHVAGVVRDH